MYLVYYNLELLIRLEKHRDHGFFDTRYLKTPLRLISYNKNKCLGTLPVCVLRAIMLCQVRDVRGRGSKVK